MKKLLAIIILSVSMCSPAFATVTTSTRTVTYSPSTSTTEFTVTFPFIDSDQLRVIKITDATGAEATLTEGTDYTVTLPVGSVNGEVTTTTAVTSTHSIRIERVTPITQETAFSTQGRFLPELHEDAFDKLTMIAQELSVGATVDEDISDAIDDHEGEIDPHSGYVLLAGRSGGQVIYGDTDASGNMHLRSTFNATKGYIQFGNTFGKEMYFDETNGRLGIGIATPDSELEIQTSGGRIHLDDTTDLYFTTPNTDGIYATTGSSASFDLTAYDSSLMTAGGQVSIYSPDHSTKANYLELTGDQFELFDTSANTLFKCTSSVCSLDDTGELRLSVGAAEGILTGGDGSGDDLILESTDNATKGLVYFGGAKNSAYDETNDRFGVGTTSPAVELDVQGEITGLNKFVATATGTSITAPDDCNTVVLVTGSGTETFTLPAKSSTNYGCEITFFESNGGTRQINISPNASDAIQGTCTKTGTDLVFSGTADKDAQLTAANSSDGDSITLVATNDGWYIKACTGKWAEES